MTPGEAAATTEAAAIGEAGATQVVRGAIVRFDETSAAQLGVPVRSFLPIDVVTRVAFTSSTIALGGVAPLSVGLALVEGRLHTHLVLGAAPSRAPVALCERPHGEPLALGVVEVIATGVFQRGQEGVTGFGAPIPTLDVAELFARVEPGVWVAATEGPPSAPTSSPDRSPPT